MLAYATTRIPEDGPILSTLERTWPMPHPDVTLSGFKGVCPQRLSGLAKDRTGRASTATLIVQRS